MTVLLFAAARDLAGADTVAVELQPGTTIADLRAVLIRRFPALAGLLAKSVLAVNHNFAEEDLILKSSDEVAVIPPVSGG